MRYLNEIVFRGRARMGNEMVVGGLLATIDEKNPKNVLEVEIEEVGGAKVRVDVETVGAFTGVLDKAGEEIFEDDIIELDGRPFGVDKWKVVFDRGAFCLMPTNGEKLFQTLRSHTALRPAGSEYMLMGRVIGNIWEY